MTGTVKQYETNKAVWFSWHDKMPNGEMVETTASFRIAQKGRGTLLKLSHTGFTDPEHFCRMFIQMGLLFDQSEISTSLGK